MTYSSLDYLIGGTLWTGVIVFTATFAYFQSKRLSTVVNKAGDFMFDGISKFVGTSVGTSTGDKTKQPDSALNLDDDEYEFYKPSTNTHVLRFGVGGKLIELGTDSRVIAYVMLRAYSDYVERDLVFVSNKAIRSNGVGRMKLEPYKGSINLTHPVLADETMKLVKPLLVSGGALLNGDVTPRKSISKTEAPVKVDSVEPSSEKPAAESPVAATKAKAMPSWKGKILDYGIGERSLTTSDEDDPDNKEPKMIKQYRLVLEIHGEQESIWGQDLHRALKDAGAVKGDLVEVLKTGRKALVDKGTAMNLYSIKKLA